MKTAWIIEGADGKPNAKDYRSGYAAGQRGAYDALGKADARGVSQDWYRGFFDGSSGAPANPLGLEGVEEPLPSWAKQSSLRVGDQHGQTGSTGRVIRQVRILSIEADGSVRVEALNGPIKGAQYSVDPSVLDGVRQGATGSLQTTALTVKLTKGQMAVITDLLNGGSERMIAVYGDDDVVPSVEVTPQFAEAIGWAFESIRESVSYSPASKRTLAALYCQIYQLDPGWTHEEVARAQAMAGVK